MKPIAIDAMGGDRAPYVNVDGAIAAARFERLRTILVGDETQIFHLIKDRQAQDLVDTEMIAIHHAAETVGMDEKIALGVRNKKSSSMYIACQLVKEGHALGVLSAGNSGAMMAISLLVVGRLENIIRPAIGAVMPSLSGTSILVDAGANTDCIPQHLFQFALMGHAYAKRALSISSPRIGVLANGEEDSKGTELTRQTLALLRQTDLNILGHCEGRDVLSGSVDVVVCDGFSGNIALKSAEGCATFVTQLIKQGYQSAGLLAKIGGFLSRPVFRQIKTRTDPREFGAAPLLGLCAPVYIAHGSSDAYAIRRAIGRVQGVRDLSDSIDLLMRQWPHLSELHGSP